MIRGPCAGGSGRLWHAAASAHAEADGCAGADGRRCAAPRVRFRSPIYPPRTHPPRGVRRAVDPRACACDGAATLAGARLARLLARLAALEFRPRARSMRRLLEDSRLTMIHPLLPRGRELRTMPRFLARLLKMLSRVLIDFDS